MKIPVKIVNTKTNTIFLDPNPALVQYAKVEKADFKIYYSEDESSTPDKKHTEDTLKCMSMKDLQTLAEDLVCDKRRKDSLIDAILKAGR